MWLSDVMQKLKYSDAIIESYTGEILWRHKQDDKVRNEYRNYLVDSMIVKTDFYGDNGMEYYSDGVLVITVVLGRS